MVLLLAVLPAAGMWLWDRVGDWQLVSGTLSHAVLVMAGSIYYLFLWMLFYGFWLDYFLDYFVVTDKRVIDIEQSGLFSRTTAEQQLGRVQDVTHVVKGFWATMFHFGHVYIQTAGEKQRFVFEDVNEPDKVAAIILQHSTRAEKTLHQSSSTS